MRVAFLEGASADDTDEVAALEQAARLDRETVEGLRGDADIRKQQVTDERARGRHDETSFRQRESNGECGADRDAERLSGVRMHPRRQVDGEDGKARGVRGADQVSDRVARRTSHAVSEQTVDEEVGVIDSRGVSRHAELREDVELPSREWTQAFG